VNSQDLQSRIARQLVEWLREAGLRVRLRYARAPDRGLALDVELGRGRRVPVVLEMCANPRLAPMLNAAARARILAKTAGGVPAVALPSVGPGLREALRSQGVGYVSLDGQVFLAGEGLLIDRRVPIAGREGVRTQGVGPFADKSSLLLRHLLGRESVRVGIRAVAQQLGVSAGLVSRLVAHLRQESFIVEEGGNARITDRAGLLDDWADYYRRRARRQRELRFYLHARSVDAVLQRLSRARGRSDSPLWGLSFQAGASLVERHAFFSEVHLLVGGDVWEDAVGELRNRLGLEPALRDANVVLVEPHYRRSWHYGLREIRGLPVVSDVQLFLDLSVYPRRGPEQAARIKERILSLGAGRGTL